MTYQASTVTNRFATNAEPPKTAIKDNLNNPITTPSALHRKTTAITANIIENQE